MLIIKIVHSSAALLSGLFFIVRGFWMLNGNQLLQHRMVKIAPHVIDTVLLVSALYLVHLLAVNPFAVDWLLAKIIALVLYIVVGTIALKRGKTKTIRTAAFGLAVLIFVYILGIAFSKSPWSWLGLLG